MSGLKDFLTEDDKKFIIDNYNNMSVYQMAIRREIKTESGCKCSIIQKFIESSNLKPNSEQSEIVAEVKKEEPSVEKIASEIANEEPTKDIDKIDESGSDEYTSISVEAFATILKEYNISVRDPLTEKEKRDILFIIHQMQAKRFILTCRTFKRKEYKDLFKEEFIRAIYGKGEMPQEEINDFIDLCVQSVNQYDIKCKIKELEKIKDAKDTTVQQKIAIDQLIIELNDKHENSSKRASEIKKTLGASREQRLKDSKPQGITILSLLDAFYNFEKRQELIKLQEKQSEELKKVISMVDEMDEAKALILGVSPDELMQGGL